MVDSLNPSATTLALALASNEVLRPHGALEPAAATVLPVAA
jgi:hypothetical protein